MCRTFQMPLVLLFYIAIVSTSTSLGEGYWFESLLARIFPVSHSSWVTFIIASDRPKCVRYTALILFSLQFVHGPYYPRRIIYKYLNTSMWPFD